MALLFFIIGVYAILALWVALAIGSILSVRVFIKQQGVASVMKKTVLIYLVSFIITVLTSIIVDRFF